MKNRTQLAAIATIALVALAVFGPPKVANAGPSFNTSVMTITPASGNVNTDLVFLNSLAVNAGAPIGYRTISAMYVFQLDANLGAVSALRTTSTETSFGTFGLDGNASFADRSSKPGNTYLSDRLLNGTTVPLATGSFELRHYWSASSTEPDFANDPYVPLPMTYDAGTGAWSVLPPATATTVAITAGASGNTITLTATVKDVNNGDTLTGAVGSFVFHEGSVEVATAPVSSGIASPAAFSAATGTHIYTAEFVPTDPYHFYGSVSGPATVDAGPPPPVDVPPQQAPGMLTLTGVSADVVLGQASLVGGTLNASGVLNATVTDTRQVGDPGWNLTGVISDFTSGSRTLDGKYLGWSTAVTGDSVYIGAGTSTPGGLVDPFPSSVLGLKASSVLAMGMPNNTGTVTNALATLQLKAPPYTRAGAYAATLTLTLI